MRPPDSIDRGAGTERVALSVCAWPPTSHWRVLKNDGSAWPGIP